MARAKRQNWSGSRPQSDAEARERLIKAALICAESKGLRRTTLADIANQAGVTRPTVYNHFEDRHAVWQGLLDRGVLIREVGPEGWLRVSVGTPDEMARFRETLLAVTQGRTA